MMNKCYFKGDMIGLFELSTMSVYNNKDHAMMHTVLGLNNPNSKEFSKITGYLTVSINVQGPGDEAVEMQMGSDSEINQNIPLISPSIKKSYKQICLRLFIAENLPKMDNLLGTIDAYCKLKWNGNKLKTRVYKQKDNRVEWFQEMLIPLELPIKDDKLILKVYD